MQVAFTPLSVADLQQIADYIDRDNPARAESFVNELEEACTKLGGTPLAFPSVPGRDLRKRSFQGYLIFYRVRRAYVEVVRVLHGSRDYEHLLPDED